MGSSNSFISNQQATATETAIKMGSQPEPSERPPQDARKATSASNPVAADATATSIDREMQCDFTDEGRGVHAASQSVSPWRSQHSADIVQRGSNARDPGAFRNREWKDMRLDDLFENFECLSTDVRQVQNILSIGMKKIHDGLMMQQQDEHEIVALRQELEDTQGKLRQTTLYMEDFKRNWKKVASELGQIRAQGKGLRPLVDSDLTSAVMQLRFTIRDFSTQHFAKEAPRRFRDPPVGSFWKYMLETTPGSLNYRDHLTSERGRSIVVQSFLWRLLVGEIFEKFAWAPWIRESIIKICDAFRPGSYGSHGLTSTAY